MFKVSLVIKTGKLLFILASLVAQLVKNPPAIQETLVRFLVRKIPCRRDRLSSAVFLGFPGSSDGKESACNAEDLGSIPGLGRSPGEGHMATHSSIKAWRIPWDSLEKGKATHSSILAWRTSWTKKPGRLQSMRSQRVRHYWATFTFNFHPYF